jgi:hypothetical protein
MPIIKNTQDAKSLLKKVFQFYNQTVQALKKYANFYYIVLEIKKKALPKGIKETSLENIYTLEIFFI